MKLVELDSVKISRLGITVSIALLSNEKIALCSFYYLRPSIVQTNVGIKEFEKDCVLIEPACMSQNRRLKKTMT